MSYTNYAANFTATLERHILQNLDDARLDNAFLARLLHTSEAQFYRTVKSHYGESPNKLIRRMRLEVAWQRLNDEKESTVREVAYSVGFVHVGYFIRRFEQRYGCKPGQLLQAAS